MYMYSLGNAVELYTYLIAKYGYLHQVRVGVGTYVMCVLYMELLLYPLR